MNIFQAVVLGIIQGITEFLPVSSSGHLVLFQNIFGITESPLTFDTCVHLGTLIAVFAFYRKDIISIIKKPFQRLTGLLILGTIPTAIIGFAFKDFFEKVFHSGNTIGIGFLVTGTVLLLSERMSSGRKSTDKASFGDAAFVGVMQGIAILPAVSRSGLTISGALIRGFDKDSAARFSFLLSIPTILGAAILQLKDIAQAGGENTNLLVLVIGGVSAAVAGYISIRFFINILKKGKLKYFSYYVYVLGILVLIDQLFTHIIF